MYDLRIHTGSFLDNKEYLKVLTLSMIFTVFLLW